MKQPLFTLIITITDQNAHLLSLTMDSILHQTVSNYEIFFIDVRQKKDSFGLLEKYKVHEKCISYWEGDDSYSLINKCLPQARGDYLHFLSSGEYYFSPKALLFMKEFIESQEFPDVVYTGYILRHSLLPAQNFFQELKKRDLKEGKAPFLRAFWVKTASLVKLGGFDIRYVSGGGFDLVCRFFLDDSLKISFMKRVLVDYQYLLEPPKKILKRVIETMQIVYNHFGITKSIFWWLAENQLRFVRWGLESAKVAISKKNIE